MPATVGTVLGDALQFDHVEMYADSMKSLSEYQLLEAMHTELTQNLDETVDTNTLVAEGGKNWAEICQKHKVTPLSPAAYTASNQDPIEQLIVAMGWRITGYYEGDEVRSIMVNSSDVAGATFIITCKQSAASEQQAKRGKNEPENLPHYKAERLDTFFNAHANRQGFAVLCFQAGPDGVQAIHDAYAAKHPSLLLYNTVQEFTEGDAVLRMTEVYAYHASQPGTRQADEHKADRGTVIRFVERSANYTQRLPGLATLPPPTYGRFGTPCYSDHWVSNVDDRKDFLMVMQDVLGFTPKVDFNAGVVGAGEAVIESTVTGNNGAGDMDRETALKNQSQIYLPTNNALSEHGHVHLYLQELGQGIQHIASRVEDLVSFINRANNMREITGQGFTFLRIPRSYYGRLVPKALEAVGLAAASAQAVVAALQAAGLVSSTNIVDLDIDEAKIEAALQAHLAPEHHAAYVQIKDQVIVAIKVGRYSNLYTLLRDHLSEDSYLKVVRNKVLVDIQGQDILYQIFTSNILQRQAGQEAPFFEFIQRVCSEQTDSCGQPRPVRPGCGGFGIRNFLTLFLSIEVSKAMDALDAATAAGDVPAANHAKQVIELFTAQMDESNPILTKISDAMTAEADMLMAQSATDDAAEQANLQQQIDEQRKIKLDCQELLKVTGERYKKAMAELRQA